MARIPFVRDVATMQTGQIVTTGCGFLASIFFARLLGLQGYGTYAIVLAFAGTLGFVTNLGQQATTLTFLSEAIGAKDAKKTREVLHYYVMLSLCSITIIGIAILFLPAAAEAMYDNAEIGKLARIILFSSMIDPVFVFGTIVLQAVREIRILMILENVRIALQLGLSILFLSMGMGVAGILLGTLIGTGVLSIWSVVLYGKARQKHNLPSWKDIIAIKEFSHIKKFGKDGIWIAIDKNIGNLYPNLFMVILGIYAQESVVGLMRLAFKLGNLPSTFVLINISKMSASVIPTLAGSGASIRKSMLKLAAYSGLIHIGITAAAIILVPMFITTVYGEAYRVAMYPFMVIAVLHLTSVIHVMTTPVLRLYSRIYYATMFNLVAFTLSLGTFFALLKSTKITYALYVALIAYHCITVMIIIPVVVLIRKRNSVQSA